MAEIIINLNNNTRMIDLRGNTPNEVAQMKASPGLAGGPVMPKMENGSGTKKIYPNDSCPCGSGKKYKKCCGRNH